MCMIIVCCGQACQVRAITDGVHEAASGGGVSLEKDEALSLELKELKQQLLVRIIDKYQVRRTQQRLLFLSLYMYVYMCVCR